VITLRQPEALCAAAPDEIVYTSLDGVAQRTLAHLGARERRELWIEPRWLGCPLAGTAPAVRARFAVYRAIAERDAQGMLRHARSQLEDAQVRGLDWARFLLDTALLGAQASGNGEEARRLWSRHAPALLGGPARPYQRYVVEWRN
jgi:hypothetical protein